MTVKDDLLVELGTEELPPKALRNLMTAFATGVREGLENARLSFDDVTPYASPRRLAVLVSSLDAGQADQEITQKGPPIAIAFDDDGEPSKAGT